MENENKESGTIYGLRPVIEAVQSGKRFERVFIKRDADGVLINDLKNMLQRYEINYQEVPIEKLNRLTRGNHQGVVAVAAAIEYCTLEQMLDAIPETEVPLIVVFDGVTDVRNFGAIARSAECAGAHGLIMSLKNSAPVNAEAIKSSAGALSRTAVHRAGSIRNTINELRKCGMQIVAADEKSDTLLYDADLRLPTVVVMGSEEKGISKEVLKLCTTRVAIPLKGQIESLNVSAAAAVILFEAVRQRR